MALYVNATAKKTTTTPDVNSIIVTARGDQCSGAPTMVVKLDGAQVGSANVAATTYTAYSFSINLAAGSHQVAISYINEYSNATCDRNLILDKVEFQPKTATTPTPTPTPTPTASGIQHVVWIAMEDQNYSDVIGSSSAPYENQLAKTYGLATNFYGTTACGGNIVSEPNWLAVTSGQTWGICDDNDPSSHPLSGANIFSQLPGGAAVAWNESMPSNCYLTNSGNYAPRHNPWTFYTNARTDCNRYDTSFSSTSGNYSVPNPTAKFTFIDPNLIDDTHNTNVATGDSFLSRYIPGLMNTANYKAGNTVIFITHDYSNDTSGHIETVVISPFTHAIKDNTKFNHYSLLLTTEQLLGLPCIANSCSATTMVGHFGL